MSTEQEPDEGSQNQEDAYVETPIPEQEQNIAGEPLETGNRHAKSTTPEIDRSPFIHGLAVGLGIGCIATFIIVWISVFFTPRLPAEVTYENLLSIFVYPLIYLLAVGLVALTAGIVREYYASKSKF
jgi:hypothetical protein